MSNARVNMRISGTKAECEEAIRLIALSGVIREQSKFYPNRGASLLGRVYLDVEFEYQTEPEDPELPSVEELRGEAFWADQGDE